MRFDFEIAVQDPRTVLVCWPVPFGKLRSEPYQVLADSLEQVPGVDKVEVLRYSAHLAVAPHVESLDEVLVEIKEQLEADSFLQMVLSELGLTDYGVAFETKRGGLVD